MGQQTPRSGFDASSKALPALTEGPNGNANQFWGVGKTKPGIAQVGFLNKSLRRYRGEAARCEKGKEGHRAVTDPPPVKVPPSWMHQESRSQHQNRALVLAQLHQLQMQQCSFAAGIWGRQLEPSTPPAARVRPHLLDELIDGRGAAVHLCHIVQAAPVGNPCLACKERRGHSENTHTCQAQLILKGFRNLSPSERF